MIFYKRVVIPAKTETIEDEIDFIACDLCKGKIKPAELYEVKEIEVSCRIGHRWPDSGYHSIIEFDVCLDCWNKKIIPFFEEHGTTVEESRCDY